MAEDEMVGCITDSVDMNLSELQEMVKDREACRAAVHGVTRVRHETTTVTIRNEMGVWSEAQRAGGDQAGGESPELFGLFRR